MDKNIKLMNRLCDHCYNEPKSPAKYRIYGNNHVDTYLCSKHIKSSFVRKYYSNHSIEYIGPRVRRYNLPLDHEYKLLSVDYFGAESATICQNCNAVITNVATVENECGTKYTVGVDCATTLGFSRCDDFWKALELEAKHKKMINYARKIKLQQSNHHNVKANIGSIVLVYFGNQPAYRFNLDEYNAYIKDCVEQ